MTGRWPPRIAKRNKSKSEIVEGDYKNGNPKHRIKFECAWCHCLVGGTEINMDHIHPVVDLEGFIGWDSYIESMFCDEDGWQVLCKGCHKVKTKLENMKRKRKKA